MKSISIVSALIVILFSCNKNKSKESSEDFSKGALLQNIADSIIIPNYEALQNELNSFEYAHQIFLTDLTLENFNDVKSNWEDLYVAWNRVSMFDFGPAKDISMQGAFGTFPSDTAQILSNIQSGTYDLSTAANLKAIGIPAFDFLFYRNNAFEDYKSDQAYQTYISALIIKMKGELQTVLSTWKTTYRSTFIASIGTESSSAFSLLINAFVKNYEDAKWAKLGIPLGKQTLDYEQPQYIEARYSKIGFQLFKTNLETLKNVYEGESGKGFDDYLIALNRSSLANSISNDFDGLISNIDGFSADFETMLVKNDKSPLNDLYTAIQNLTVSLKTDMTSAFGVLITYQDNDGD